MGRARDANLRRYLREAREEEKKLGQKDETSDELRYARCPAMVPVSSSFLSGMERRQLNTLRMGRGVLALFDGAETTTGWGARSVLKTTVQTVRALVNGMAHAGLTQEQLKTNGLTLRKDEQLNVMGDLTEWIVRGLRPYAKITNDKELLTGIDFSHTDLTQGPEERCVNRCQLVHDAAKGRVTELAEHGVTQTHLDAQQLSIDTFRPLAGLRDATAAQRQAATESLPQYQQQLREQLDILDDLTQNLIEDDAFKGAYRAAREIIDQRGPGKAPADEPAA